VRGRTPRQIERTEGRRLADVAHPVEMIQKPRRGRLLGRDGCAVEDAPRDRRLLVGEGRPLPRRPVELLQRPELDGATSIPEG